MALNRLKLVAASRLPSWEVFYRFFGAADDEANVAAYDRLIAPHLDPAEPRLLAGPQPAAARPAADLDLRPQCLSPRRARPLHRRHPCRRRASWRRSARAVERPHAGGAARVLRDDAGAAVRQARRCAGRPPTACRSTASASRRRSTRRWPAAATCAHVLRARLERLACGFSLDDNYFAWQAFGRSYAGDASGPLPPYLRREHFDAVRARVDRVEVLNRSITEYLAGCPDASRDRYVLLDAQDWMTDDQLNALWRRDHPHRPARRARDLPHRRRAVAAARPCRPRAARPLALRGRAVAGDSPRATVRRSMAASISMSSKAEHERHRRHADLMDRIYRRQRHVYDATRKYYLLGRDRLIERPGAAGRRPGARDRLRHGAQSRSRRRAPIPHARLLRHRHLGRDARDGARLVDARGLGAAHPARPRRRHDRSIPRCCSACRASRASSCPTACR